MGFHMSSSRDEARIKWFFTVCGYILVMGICFIFFEDVIPYTFFELFQMKGSVSIWLYSALPIFCWPIFLNVFFVMNGNKRRPRNMPTFSSFFEKALLVSLKAGLYEELLFRWIIFFGAIGSLLFGNYLIFGFAGFGLIEWFHMNFFGPLIDFLSFGQLTSYIYHPHSWSVGAAMITANATFRDGHKYQGWFGFINSWFIGFYLFWIMFNYGLPAAILVHFLYDVICFSAAYFTVKVFE